MFGNSNFCLILLINAVKCCISIFFKQHFWCCLVNVRFEFINVGLCLHYNTHLKLKAVKDTEVTDVLLVTKALWGFLYIHKGGSKSNRRVQAYYFHFDKVMRYYVQC